MKARPPIKSEQRQDGVYRTPWLTAKYMISRILPYVDSDSRILDPATGDGVFVRALIDAGVKPEQITAQDINSEKVALLKDLGVETGIADTLLDRYETFDVIIGNPPYKSRRQSNYMKVNKRALEKKYGFIGLYNLYALFTVSAIEHVKENGIICFILQDPFMTNRYYRKFRDYLLSMVSIQEITLAPWRLFHRSGADVRTAIIILQKTSGPARYEERMSKLVRLIDRLPDEKSYWNPPKEQSVAQAEFHRMPDRKFFIGIPLELIKLVQNPAQRFGDVSEGGTGISTGNDAKYLRRREEVASDPQWVGFYKSGKRRSYYYETPFYIEKEFEKNERSSKDFIVRNRKYFFQEGITCSSVGRRFSAAYLPEGNLFGVNANFFFKSPKSLFYSLGLLNSQLYAYLSRKVLHRSNITATSFLRELPFVHPPKLLKDRIIALVKSIIAQLKENPSYDFTPEQNEIDSLVFEIFQISKVSQQEIRSFTSNIMELA